MKENNELERSDLAVDSDMQVDCDIGQEIICYLETWFDVDKKFNIHTADDDGTWLNMYARYNPYEDTLRIECVIDTDDEKPNQTFDYEPTSEEAKIMKELITEKIRAEYGMTPEEFCEDVCGESEGIGGIQ